MMWLIVFLVLAVVLVALAVHLLRAPRTACLSDLDILCDTQIDRYAHVRRLLAPDDFAFLAENRRAVGLAQRLHRERVRILSLYLNQMRFEFHSLVAIASLFAAAPTARNEKFAARITRMRLRFAFLSLHLWLAIRLNRLLSLPLDLAPALGYVRELRKQADRVLHLLTPQDLAVLRATLRG